MCGGSLGFRKFKSEPVSLGGSSWTVREGGSHFRLNLGRGGKGIILGGASTSLERGAQFRGGPTHMEMLDK